MASDSKMSGFVRIEDVGMTFDTRRGPYVALAGIDLSIAKGEFVALIGHSGCGKSTLLNLVAGLLLPTQGVLLCAEREIAGPGPDRGVVFQNHSLLPWLTCHGNVHLAVERVFGGRETRAQMKARVSTALKLVHLGHAEHKYPGEISGGMKQRVGIARALAMEPNVLLLDEPFGALDAFTREELWCVIRDLHAARPVTIILVTHDLREAAFLADRIFCMSSRPGRIVAERRITFPRPRSLEVTYTTEFTDIVHDLRSQIASARQAA